MRKLAEVAGVVVRCDELLEALLSSPTSFSGAVFREVRTAFSLLSSVFFFLLVMRLRLVFFFLQQLSVFSFFFVLLPFFFVSKVHLCSSQLNGSGYFGVPLEDAEQLLSTAFAK